MKRFLLLLIPVALIGVLVLVAVLAVPKRQPGLAWTTESPRAREAFEQALTALSRSYWDETTAQLDRALELDPSFAMARLFRDMVDHEMPISQRIEHLRAIDQQGLLPREQVMIEAMLASLDGDPARASALFDAYLSERPDDPFIRYASCTMAWDRLDWARAEPCYEELLERHPNFVEAQNHLGYIAMADGRFRAAEERFEAYRFVAPDQANPYDSLAELALLRGDLDSAEIHLETALGIHPDFCPARLQLIQVAAFARQFEQARRLLAETEAGPACQNSGSADMMFCNARMRLAYAQGAFEDAWQAGEQCPEARTWSATAHRSALLTGRVDEARAIERSLADYLETTIVTAGVMQQATEALLLSFEGSQLMATGRFTEAAQRFRDADAGTRYWGQSQVWMLKLFNRVDFLVALRRSGAEAEADAEEAALEELNPLVIDYFAPGARALADLGARKSSRR